MTTGRNELGLIEEMLRQTRREWRSGAAQAHYGRCDSCGRCRDEDDEPLFVARQPRRRKLECFVCFLGEGPTARAKS